MTGGSGASDAIVGVGGQAVLNVTAEDRMRVRVDAEVDAAYVTLRKSTVERVRSGHTECVYTSELLLVNVDIDADGRPVGVEIVDMHGCETITGEV